MPLSSDRDIRYQYYSWRAGSGAPYYCLSSWHTYLAIPHGTQANTESLQEELQRLC